jgi:non-specific serine/threonine protein kinase/serine/threonine-protein kinase
MSAGEWSRITELFEQALDRPPAERDGWLLTACGDAAVRAEVEAMLRAYDEDPGFLEAPADASAAVEALEREVARLNRGRRFGAYRTVREIGRGGMGVVYEARRDDEEFDRRVAIKVLPGAWAAPGLAERFRFERRVLADLDHQHIARLLDAGTTDEGVPFFVMEYVDGQPIDAWCRERALGTRRRVEVLLAVCEAVGHAHQRLVVHRDLKPANILVTGDGVPKLLDFGIATLVQEEGGTNAGLTRTGQSSFTPEYASPEQVRGERVTTATDVYSLGVLAYKVITDRPPYDLAGLSPVEVMRTVCDREPPPASSVAPATAAHVIRGDLDRVLAKALRKDPRDRYATVFALAQDLSAWLGGRTVSAAPSTIGHRMRQFVSRHRIAVASGAAVLAALLVGGGAAVWQARIAGQERDKANRRFREVRQFSRSLLFEVHQSLRAVPGATESRRLLVDRAVQFLDALAADAIGDDGLMLELAEGYRTLGQLQGSATSENVGDITGAIASFEKAARLAEQVAERRPQVLGPAHVATAALDGLSSTLLEHGDTVAADRAYERHLSLVQRLEATQSGSAAARGSIAASYVNLGRFRSSRNDRATARSFYEKAIGLYEGLPEDERTRDGVMSHHAVALKRLGALHLAAGELDDGERRYRAALAIEEQLLTRHPGHPTYRYDITFTLGDLAFLARKRGDSASARQQWLRALAIRQAILEADPRNVRAMRGVANLHGYLSRACRDLKQFDEALAHNREAMRLNERLVEIRGRQAVDLYALASAQLFCARALVDLAAASPTAARSRLTMEAAALLRVAEPGVLAPATGAAPDPALREVAREVRAALRTPAR